MTILLTGTAKIARSEEYCYRGGDRRTIGYFSATAVFFVVYTDNTDENSMVPVKSSMAEIKHSKPRGIWSLADVATCSGGNVSTATTTTLCNGDYFQFCPSASLIPHLSTSALHKLTPASDDVIHPLPVICSPELRRLGFVHRLCTDIETLASSQTQGAPCQTFWVGQIPFSASSPLPSP